MAELMDRYYRGRCPHGFWAAILTGEPARVEWVEVTCPAGCNVILVTSEAPPDA